MESFKSQFCPKGHDTFICGRFVDGSCKFCKKLYQENRKEIKKKYDKQVYEYNKEEILNKRKEYYTENKEKLITYQHEKYLINRENIRIKQKEYHAEHKQEILERHNRNFERRMLTDINFKLAINLRSRLHVAIKNNYKAGSAVRDLGCSIDYLKQYIESKFYNNMTWDNWGTVWQLDHIRELHTFDLTDRKQFLDAVHYTNLQPLTIRDHQKKTAKGRIR